MLNYLKYGQWIEHETATYAEPDAQARKKTNEPRLHFGLWRDVHSGATFTDPDV